MTERGNIVHPRLRAALGMGDNLTGDGWIVVGRYTVEGGLHVLGVVRERVPGPDVAVRPVAEQAARMGLTKREGGPGDDAIWSGVLP